MELANLFPDKVAIVIADESMWQKPLRAEEELLIEGAIAKRQGEFRAGRNAAHAALAQLQVPDQPILQGAKRQPLWPDGIVGTIAHTRGLCVAACSLDGDIAGLGIDVEPLTPLPKGVDRYIHTGDDTLLMRDHKEIPHRLIFSAKESLYKCYYPLVERYFGFQSVTLVDVGEGEFGFRPTEECKIEFPREMQFHGRYHTNADYLFTACYLTRK